MITQKRHAIDEALSGLPNSAQVFAKKLLNNPSARLQRRTVRTDFVSRKSPRILQLTSRKLEFPLALQLESDPSCTLLIGNLPPLELPRLDSSIYRHECTLMAISKGRAELYDCRSGAEIRKANRNLAGLFVRASDGTWTSPRLTKLLAEVDVTYRIVADDAINPTRTRNLLYLQRYLQPAATPLFSTELIEQLRSFVAKNSGLSLSLLDDRFNDRDLVNFCLARGHVAFDLDDIPLTQRASVRVYADAIQVCTAREALAATRRTAAPLSVVGLISLKPMSRLEIDGVLHEVVSVFPTELYLTRLTDGSSQPFSRAQLDKLCREERIAQIDSARDTERATTEFIRSMSSRDHAAIAERMKAIFPHVAFRLQRGPKPSQALTRTQRRWLASYFKGLRRGENPTLALAPRIVNRGSNRTRKGSALRQCFFRIVKDLHASGVAPDARSVWRQLLNQFDQPISYETVRRWVNEFIANQNHTARRIGARAAYRRMRPNLAETQVSFPPDTSHVEYVADSTQVDLRLVSEVTGKVIATRLNITLLVDSFSGRLVGFWLYLGQQSRRASFSH